MISLMMKILRMEMRSCPCCPFAANKFTASLSPRFDLLSHIKPCFALRSKTAMIFCALNVSSDKKGKMGDNDDDALVGDAELRKMKQSCEGFLGCAGRMLISRVGRQGVGFGLLLSFTTCPQHHACAGGD